MKSFVIAALALCQIALATPAAAVQLFDFDAQAILPATVGGTAEVYGIIVNGTAVDTPLPLDFANYQYTVVITDLVMDSAAATSTFSNGVVAIYEDGTTAADWANTASFNDGTAIIVGIVTSVQHTMFTSTLGSAQGFIDWTGGTRLSDLAVADQTGWPLLTSISRSVSLVEPGYTEKWDGKIEPTEEVVANEEHSWSDVKALFR